MSPEIRSVIESAIPLQASQSLECPVCLALHDEEIHAATINVHRWFRYQVTKRLDDPIIEDLEAMHVA